MFVQCRCLRDGSLCRFELHLTGCSLGCLSSPSGTGPSWIALADSGVRPKTEDGASLTAEPGVMPPNQPAASSACAGDDRRDFKERH